MSLLLQECGGADEKKIHLVVLCTQCSVLPSQREFTYNSAAEKEIALLVDIHTPTCHTVVLLLLPSLHFLLNIFTRSLGLVLQNVHCAQGEHIVHFVSGNVYA